MSNKYSFPFYFFHPLFTVCVCVQMFNASRIPWVLPAHSDIKHVNHFKWIHKIAFGYRILHVRCYFHAAVKYNFSPMDGRSIIQSIFSRKETYCTVYNVHMHTHTYGYLLCPATVCHTEDSVHSAHTHTHAVHILL